MPFWVLFRSWPNFFAVLRKSDCIFLPAGFIPSCGWSKARHNATKFSFSNPWVWFKQSCGHYLNLGTTFHITEKRDSGEMAAFSRCQIATSVFRSSSTKNLHRQNEDVKKSQTGGYKKEWTKPKKQVCMRIENRLHLVPFFSELSSGLQFFPGHFVFQGWQLLDVSAKRLDVAAGET